MCVCDDADVFTGALAARLLYTLSSTTVLKTGAVGKVPPPLPPPVLSVYLCVNHMLWTRVQRSAAAGEEVQDLFVC